MHRVPDYVATLQSGPSEAIPCPLCGSRDHEPVYEGIALRGNDLVCVMCRSCTHLFLNPRPPMETYKSFYATDGYFHLCANFSQVTFDEKMSQFDDPAFWPERFAHGHRLNDVYLKGAIGPGDVVFDFGCGDGGWLGGLREATGCEIAGQEISAFYRDVIRKHFGIEVYLGPAEELREPIVRDYEGKVALALISGSLQHMLDPMECLSIARDILKDDGLLYVCNWNLFDHYMTPYEGDLGRLLGEVLSWEHTHYFHERSLGFMLERAGFEVLEFERSSRVRSRHMDALARKSDLGDHVAPWGRPEDVVARLRALETATVTERLRKL